MCVPAVADMRTEPQLRRAEVVEDLVRRAQAGEQAGWDELVTQFAPLVWAICRRFRLSHTDAHDVGQNVWLRLVEHLSSLREPAALPGWLATTTHRECIRFQRVARERTPDHLPADFELGADPDTTQVDRSLLAEERAQLIRAAFTQLQPRCKQLLLLLMADPPTEYTHISQSLHMPIGAIGPNRARCLDKLRRSPALASLAEREPSRSGGTNR